MPVSRRVVGGDERAPRVAGPQQHGLSAATSESTVSATTRHGPRPRVMGELVRTVVTATMALRTARFLARRDGTTRLSAPARFLATIRHAKLGRAVLAKITNTFLFVK